ncbi:excinuclease [Kurthia sibirica]|uniref:Excinuclease n=1 Tax=Kurthia sibirica TaxID=202750 RepID=A0A2U3AJG9_9BACL|nr:excinuclease [Kurthia sibirica]PWI24703.1 excinuclease [Kurthia sibirica]GEK34545.1 hypothetical protein KSI01_20780 [Kurthia sibirica]
MNTRYKITRLDEAGQPTITLEESLLFFATQPDFIYNDSFIVNKDDVQMKITGHFFMWQIDEVQVPFRFFDGELFVAISHPAILARAHDITAALEATMVEG